MKQFLFLFAAALLMSASVSGAIYVDPPRYGYAHDYNPYESRFVRYAPSASYVQPYITAPSSSTLFREDKYAISYSARTTNGLGQTHVQGYYVPKPYQWECSGTACGKTQYLSGVRARSMHPPAGFAYDYSMQRTYW